MNIRVNGEERTIDPGTVADLVGARRLDADRVVVERNRAVVPRRRWADTVLREHDVIEIVCFVGGG